MIAIMCLSVSLPPTSKHWRCGGIHCLSSPEPMMNKVTTAHYLFYCLALFVCWNGSWVAICLWLFLSRPAILPMHCCVLLFFLCFRGFFFGYIRSVTYNEKSYHPYRNNKKLIPSIVRKFVCKVEFMEECQNYQYECNCYFNFTIASKKIYKANYEQWLYPPYSCLL